MLIKNDQDMIKNYLEDTSVMPGAKAEAVIIAESQDEIPQILKEASKNHTPITISSGKTGTTGGCIPLKGKILSVEKLNKIININKKNLTATVECGVVLEDLQKALAKENLVYLPDPTESTCLLGGTLATNASGSRTFKYGPTRNHVKRIKVVLSTGEILDIERGKIFAEGRRFETIKCDLPSYEMPMIKNAAGYYVYDNMDLIDLFIGSEGTLGVIVEMDLKIAVKPEKIFGGIVYFNNPKDCLNFVKEVRQISLESKKSGDITKLSAASIEYLDQYTLDLIREKNPSIPKDAKAAIFFEQESTETVEDDLLQQWSDLIEKHGADLDQCRIALTELEDKELKEIRHSIPETINEIFKRTGFQKLATDIAVPADAFDEMMAYYDEILKPLSIHHLAFGHIGNYHLHVNQLPKNNEEKELALKNIKLFVTKAVQLGGTISAEHGIGKIKKPYLKIMYGENGIKEMAAVKKALDPALILNLDNIFEEKYLR
ncbi:MAG: FAD-binding oxidoreductase [Candidatus Margulisbacteria bacterium]|nr:FAD-binding oxidoreductase [Candidatus Margulisiibacteriota bacterium]MBU1022012.1 FAD-binding oxidoreductase [Candidatus Margulisiibacteriota bacterium]MBU1729865.1 FAD-binding oxidoreductase [Candidatus Margulisiibacteriota bacterium]MBU1955195.1 FAD-binding oxidoreductase [Candidatus Margulisiibacteriota bacterium]